jgi:multidrug efflux pump subunit AcrB
LNTTFSARVPQLFAEVDRTKAANLNVPLSSVFGALQAYLGSAYVNDFNRFGRTYQVRVQADQKYRMQAEDIGRLDVRNAEGAMVPLGTLVNVRPSSGAQVITRYNLYPSAQINGEAAPGFSSGDSLLLMEQMADAQLPDGMGFEWTGMSYQEKLASGGQYGVFVLAIVFVFLVLAAQYESWSSPAAIIAVVPLAALGVVLALLMTGQDNNSYTQIGVVLLVALGQQERHPDRRVCPRVAARGQEHPRRGGRSGSDSVPRHLDDRVLVHPRVSAPGARQRCRRRQSPGRRQRHRRRHDRRHRSSRSCWSRLSS